MDEEGNSSRFYEVTDGEQTFYLDDFVSTRDTYIGLVSDPPPASIVFAHGFESGGLTQWTVVPLPAALPLLASALTIVGAFRMLRHVP